MKLSSILQLLLVLPSALVFAAPELERRAFCVSPQAPNAVHWRQLYSSANTDHLYTANGWDELTAGYDVQTRNVAWIFSSTLGSVAGLIPLYRLYQTATKTHVYTASPSLRDTLLTKTQPPYVLDGISNGVTGYVFPDGTCPGTVPLWWASSSAKTDNYYTIDAADYNSFVASGYTPKGIVAWVYPVPANQIWS